jgi:membrane-associated phospholipid phosphatase
MFSFARLAGRVRWCRERLDLTWRGWCALVVAIGALGASVAVVGGVSEDVTQHNGLANRDVANLSFFTGQKPDFVLRAAHLVTRLGGIALLALLAVGTGLLLWRRGVPLAAAAAPAFALGVAATLAAIGKQVIDRGGPGAGLRVVADGEPSFPSGHATDSAALYLTLGLIVAIFVLKRPLARVATVACSAVLVAAIGVTRLVLGVHWPTDVFAGWALGATAALGAAVGATLLTRLIPRASTPPEGRIRRAAARLGRLLTAEHSPSAAEESSGL